MIFNKYDLINQGGAEPLRAYLFIRMLTRRMTGPIKEVDCTRYRGHRKKERHFDLTYAITVAEEMALKTNRTSIITEDWLDLLNTLRRIPHEN